MLRGSVGISQICKITVQILVLDHGQVSFLVLVALAVLLLVTVLAFCYLEAHLEGEMSVQCLDWASSRTHVKFLVSTKVGIAHDHEL